MAKILIIDDSGLSRRMLRQMLESGGYEVIEAVDGIAGLEKYFLEKPDLVMLDMTMAGMTGLEVLEKLKQMDPEATVIVATADIQSSTRVLVEAAGAVSLINKPLDKDTVLKTVAHHLNLKR